MSFQPQKSAPAPSILSFSFTGVTPLLRDYFPCVAATIATFSVFSFELLMASYATFLFGEGIFHYSTVIALLMASLGAGALLSARIQTKAPQFLLATAVCLSVLMVGTLPLLYFLFSVGIPARPILLLTSFFSGMVIGMEIPLLNRLNSSQSHLIRVLSGSYFGGFLGGITFPLYLFPKFGFFQLGGIFGLMNTWVALTTLWLFRERFQERKSLWISSVALATLIATLFSIKADSIRHLMEFKFFNILLTP